MNYFLNSGLFFLNGKILIKEKITILITFGKICVILSTNPTAQHGSKVAGIAAAQANNNKCGVGIAYEANIGGKKMDIIKSMINLKRYTLNSYTIALYRIFSVIFVSC